MAKKYNTRFQLTPMPKINRWRKKYHGKLHYVGVGHCNSKFDREGYTIALAEWKELKAKLDNAPTEGETTRYEELKAGRAKWRGLMAEVPPAILETFKSSADADRRIVEKVEGRKRKNTIGQAIADFVARKMSQHTLGDLSSMRVHTIDQHLRYFVNWAGKDSPLSSINEDMVTNYFDHLVRDVNARTFGKTTAFDKWAVFKQFVSKQYTKIAIPRNLNDTDYAFRKPVKAVTPFPSHELNELLNKTPELFSLYILLMLNCGMYSGDISDLKPTEVDWKEGTITRKRSKTKDNENAPVVSYKLWDRTFDLLVKYGKTTGDKVFTNRKGGALVYHTFRATGKMTTYNSIYKSYLNLMPDMAKHHKLMAIRKAGASTLGGHDTYMFYIEHYLGHSPITITDKSYRKPTDASFFEALKWLGEQFGIK